METAFTQVLVLPHTHHVETGEFGIKKIVNKGKISVCPRDLRKFILHYIVQVNL